MPELDTEASNLRTGVPGSLVGETLSSTPAGAGMAENRAQRDATDRLRLIRPLVDFLHTEAAGGVALVIAAIVALAWANSPWDASYRDLWTTDLTVALGDRRLDLDLRHWINDGLMAIFFFVVGLEIKRELVDGELRDPRKAALPACAALGGVVAPALIYAAFNVVVGGVLWVTLHESGIHATLAGVVLGLMTPTQPIRRPELVDAAKLADVSSYRAARQTATAAREAGSVVEWLEHPLHPWTSFVVVPLFALANAGVALSGDTVGDALSSPVAGGIVFGLVVGKVVGITGFTWLATRLRIATLPEGSGWSGIVGVGALAGIGFTVSIFVTGLAFGGTALEDQAKVAILGGSLLAAAIGSVVIVATSGRAGGAVPEAVGSVASGPRS